MRCRCNLAQKQVRRTLLHIARMMLPPTASCGRFADGSHPTLGVVEGAVSTWGSTFAFRRARSFKPQPPGA